jgi:acid phosphatase
MKRASRCLHIVAATVAVTAVIAAGPASAQAEACPTAVPDHIPATPLQPLNLGIVKDLLLEYHQKYYDLDVAAVFDSAQKYIEQNFEGTNRPALILDIDETSLSNWPSLLADNLGFIVDGSCDALPAGPCGLIQWMLKGNAKAIEPARKLFEAAKARGIAVIFVTGRPNRLREVTILNLDRAGFNGWAELRTRPDRDDLPTMREFKTAERAKIEAEGYTIVANVGDQISDLEGEHSGCRFKVPNPFYQIR